MALETLEATLVGTAPLLCHAKRGMDPSEELYDTFVSLQKKREKSADDIEQLRRIEWELSIWVDAAGLPCIPADNILKLVADGSAKWKRGKKALAGVFEASPTFGLIYPGPKEIDELYRAPGFCDFRHVRIPPGPRGKVVSRARFRLAKWSLPIALFVNTDAIKVKEVIEALVYAGEMGGLGDWRPRFGRFSVEIK